MRTKLTATIALLASATVAAVALAGPVPVAVYTFEAGGDVAAFQKQAGKSCGKKWRQGKSMSIAVGGTTNRCTFDTSVVGDSTDPGSDMEVTAAANLGAGRSKKLRNKAYVGVAARSSATAGYELRVRPYAGTWQLFRDAAGASGPVLLRSGKGKFIRSGGKPNMLLLRAFDFSTPTTNVLAKVNGKAVATFADSGTDQPDGRRSAVVTGIKGKGSGNGVVGIFDNVAIKVPNPF